MFFIDVFIGVWISLKRRRHIESLIILTLATTVKERDGRETLPGEFVMAGGSSAS